MEFLKDDNLFGIALLYVEDEKDARDMLVRIFAMKYPGLSLFVAQNGAEGLEVFRERQPDIVIADMNMPIMDGVQMSKEMKELNSEVIIIAMTAHNDPSYLLSAIEIGIRHYVLKPIKSKELFSIINNTIEEIRLKRLVREQEMQIRKRERQLSEAQKIAHIGSWEWDIATEKTSWSDELYRIFGFEPGAVPASYEAFLDRVHPGDRESVIQVIKKTLSTSQSFNHYCRIIRPDGSIRIVHGQGEVILDDAGKPVSMVGTSHDITERRQIEEERSGLASIVESSNDAIIALNFDGVLTSWNKGAETIYGYSASEVIGKDVSMLVPPGCRDEISHIRQLISNGENIMPIETVRIRKDGRPIYVSLTASPTKDLDGRITGISAIARDVTERRELEETIKHQAHHDALTDLPNRQLFLDFLSLELAQARRNGKKLALLFMDLNGFKQVNDSLGHIAGDRLLQEVAQRLKDCIRESDTVARIGGDEFTVLMPDLSQTDDVGIVLRKIRNVFETPFMLEGVATGTSASIGVSMFPDDGWNSEELIKKADIAMYDAKASGWKSYQFFNAELNERTMKRQAMETLLRQAVDRGEMELLFQPLVRVDTRAIIGAEALLRWRHPEQGLLSPDQFLDIAEDTGAIVSIGDWVIRTVCTRVREWNEKGYPLSVTVNLSNRQFHQPNFVEKTARILTETGLKPQLLEFEITENTIMYNIDFSFRNMNELTGMGVNLSIDNFGSGSSSLRLIKKMPTHKVKIDKSFVKNMLTVPDDMAVLNSIIAMSHNLKMRVVANGVETEDQLSAIQRSGCDEVQGYVISEPLSPYEFERLVVGY